MDDMDGRTDVPEDGGRARSGIRWFSGGLLTAAVTVATLIGFGISLDDVVDSILDRVFPSAGIRAPSSADESAALRAELETANDHITALQRSLEQASETIRDLRSEPPGDVASPGVSSSQEPSATRSMRLTDLEPIVDVGLWDIQPATVGGREFSDAYVISTEWGDDGSSVEYAINGSWGAFTAQIGIEDGGNSSEKASIEVFVDDEPREKVTTSIGEPPRPVTVDLAGADRLRLEVVDLSQSAYAAQVVIGQPELRTR